MRVVARLVLVVAVFAAGLAAAAPAQADREFSLRYTANETGSIKGIANTNMTCSTASGATGASTCVDARNASVTDSINQTNNFRNNNAHTSAYIDVDSDSSTFNSSTANQSLPAGSTVLYAALYWGGHYSGASSPANASHRNRVQLKLPGSSAYQTVTADVLDDGIGGNAGRYQGFANVTSLVQGLPNAGNGTYAVGNVQSAIGSDRYAGWSLVVAYRNPNESVKNLSIFDGLVSIGLGDSRQIDISGFLTPPAGPLNAQIGFITWEGDLGLNGDRAELNGHYLSDNQHPSNNFFDSRISHNGTLFTDRNPAYPNSMGMDAAWTTPPAGSITHNQTSARIKVNSVGEQYLPGVITFQVEIFAPKVDQTKSVVDDNGGALEQGDVITYTVAGKNTGDDGTSNFVLRDPIPANTTYVPGSLQIVKNAGAATGAATDPAGDDRAEYDPVSDRVVFRLGQGSNSSVGGNIAPGQEYEVRFKVKVNGPAPDAVPNLTRIDNKAVASFNSKIGGTPLTTEADAGIKVKSPDLKITKIRSGADFTVGGSSEYTLKVNNHGDARTQGEVTVSDPLPAGLTATAVTAPGWTCNTLPADSVTCSRSDVLPAGQSYPDIVIAVAIDDSVAAEVENTSTVSGGGDGNLGDNTSSSTNPASRTADLAITKTASQTSVKIGDVFSYELKVTNNGPSKATSVAVSDEIPAGLSYVSSDPGCVFEPASGTVGCELGTLANGASTTVTITVEVDGDAGGQITNVASVSAQQTDPNPGNNVDTEIVDASGADLEVKKKLTSPAPVKTGDTVVYKISVRNLGPSAATGVVLYDALPGGLTDVEVDKTSCEVADGAITCTVGNLAVGASYTATVTGKVKAGQTQLVNTASATGNEDDPNPGNNTDEVTTPVIPVADLGIVKEASVTEITVGEAFEYTFKVTNNGPDNVTGITVTDTLPAGLTFVQGAPGCNAVGQVVTCSINFLAAGGHGQTGITVKYSGDGDTVENTAAVSSDAHDPNPDNDRSTEETPVVQKADVSIVKSASPSNPRPGDVVTYTLTVKNNGPATAAGVVVTDSLPDGVTFISVDDPCVEEDGDVSCVLGDLAAGEEIALQIKVKVDPWGVVNPGYQHLLDVQKVETQIDLEPGETRTVEAQCPDGFFVSDGSVRVDHIDQGAGDWDAPQVLKSAASDLETWQGVVRNTATGRAQAKIFAVCIRKTSSPNAHQHKFKVSKPFTVTKTVKSGKAGATLKCGENQVAIQPGFESTVPGHLRYSQPEGDGWKFKFDSNVSGGEVTFSIRCMNKQLKSHNGHTHDLQLERIWSEVEIGPNAVHEVQLTCPDGSRGIVGGWDLGKKLIPLGNDPRPVTRAFKVYNPTDKPQTARFSLLCLGDRTGGEVLLPKKIVNTAHVSATTPDPDESNNSSTVKIKAEDGKATQPVEDGNGKPVVNNPTGSGKGSGKSARPSCRIVGNSVRYRKRKVTVRVKCSGKSRGSARLTSTRKVRIKGKSFGKGTVLARGSYRFGSAGTRTVTLRATAKGRRILNRGQAKRAKLSIPGSGRIVKVR